MKKEIHIHAHKYTGNEVFGRMSEEKKNHTYVKPKTDYQNILLSHTNHFTKISCRNIKIITQNEYDSTKCTHTHIKTHTVLNVSSLAHT